MKSFTGESGVAEVGEGGMMVIEVAEADETMSLIAGIDTEVENGADL